MNLEVQKLATIVKYRLVNNSPILSGNLKAYLNIMQQEIIDEDTIRLTMKAPFYDLNHFNKTGVIIQTTPKGTITDYALQLNEEGAFGKHNSSEHWTNRAIYEAVNVYASGIGATVINELEL